MGLLKRASGVLKDQNSLWQAKLSRRTALRNPEIKKSVILATSHHALSLDTRNAEHVCDWLLASKLAEDGRFEDFLMVLESVVASGHGDPPSPTSTGPSSPTDNIFAKIEDVI